MLNERIDTIRLAGVEALEIRFDLADDELRALARSVAAVARDRYRIAALDAGDVHDLRELATLHDTALERAEDGYAGGTLVFGERRLELTLNALSEWLDGRRQAEWLRADEARDLSSVESLIGDLQGLEDRTAVLLPV